MLITQWPDKRKNRAGLLPSRGRRERERGKEGQRERGREGGKERDGGKRVGERGGGRGGGGGQGGKGEAGGEGVLELEPQGRGPESVHGNNPEFQRARPIMKYRIVENMLEGSQTSLGDNLNH